MPVFATAGGGFGIATIDGSSVIGRNNVGVSVVIADGHTGISAGLWLSVFGFIGGGEWLLFSDCCVG